MLDLRKIAGQMQALSQQVQTESKQQKLRLDMAETLLQRAIEQQDFYTDQYQQWHDRFPFNCAVPVQPLTKISTANAYLCPHQIIATDGSQIAPSRHESVYCYLLNIGRILISYHTGKSPLIDSMPAVYYQPDELYRGKQWGITTEEWMKWQRTIAEVTHLAQLADHLDPTHPTLALMDGTLIYWELEHLPRPARTEILAPILSGWQTLRSRHIPLIAYISSPRASDSSNFLRLSACPHNQPDCPTHCADLRLDKLPCSQAYPLQDASLWQRRLAIGQISPLFRSSAPITNEYGEYSPDQHIYFSYLNLGIETARLEMPAWTALDQHLRTLAYSLVLTQIQKGYGYPIALTEAHNQAVVTSSDRQRFFSTLQIYLQKIGINSPTITRKETRKRNSPA